MENKTNAELVEIYNSIPGVKKVKRFSDRKTALKRIQEAQKTTEAITVKPVPITTYGIQLPREGSRRHQALLMARGNCSFDELCQRCRWNKSQAMEAIRILRRMGHDVRLSQGQLSVGEEKGIVLNK